VVDEPQINQGVVIMAYDNELDDWRREQAQLRSEADYDRLETLRADRYDGDDDGAEDEEGDGDDGGEDSRVSGYMPDNTYDGDDDDIKLGDEPDNHDPEPSPDLTDDDILDKPTPALPSAEDLDTVADEQSIAEATSTSHPVTETPSPTPAAQPKAKKKSKSVRKPKPARVSKSGVKRPPAKPKKGKEGKGKK